MKIESTIEIQEYWKGTIENKSIWVFLSERSERLQFKTQEAAVKYITERNETESGIYRLVLVSRVVIDSIIKT